MTTPIVIYKKKIIRGEEDIPMLMSILRKIYKGAHTYPLESDVITLERSQNHFLEGGVIAIGKPLIFLSIEKWC